MGIRNDLSIFSKIIQKPSNLSLYKTNPMISMFCDYVTNPYIQFPPIDISNLTFFGYPKESYLQERYEQFTKQVLPFLSGCNSFKSKKETIITFLSSCHGGETLTDETGKKLTDVNIPEYLFYYYLLIKSEVIPYKTIFKSYPLFNRIPSKQKIIYPATFYYQPIGASLTLEVKKNNVLIRDTLNYGVDFDFLKLDYGVDFKANIIVSIRWLKTDSYYYRDRYAKWNEMLLSGIKKEDVRIFVQSSNISYQDVEQIFASNNIRCSKLSQLYIENESELKSYSTSALLRNYRGIMSGNNIYIAKRSPRKTFKIVCDNVDDNNYDLINHNVSYILVPEKILKD